MELLVASAVGLVTAVGIYLVLRAQTFPVVLGLTFLSYAVNVYLFAMGRLPGWIAHWAEMHQDPDFKIGRPRQVYTGPTCREYVPIEER